MSKIPLKLEFDIWVFHHDLLPKPIIYFFISFQLSYYMKLWQNCHRNICEFCQLFIAKTFFRRKLINAQLFSCVIKINEICISKKSLINGELKYYAFLVTILWQEGNFSADILIPYEFFTIISYKYLQKKIQWVRLRA